MEPCEQPGTICTWMGEPGVAGVSADGLDRDAFRLYLPVDIEPAAD